MAMASSQREISYQSFSFIFFSNRGHYLTVVKDCCVAFTTFMSLDHVFGSNMKLIETEGQG